MNEFTKKELISLEHAFYDQTARIMPEWLDCSPLLKKLNNMIDNYDLINCRHETDQGGCGGDAKYLCKKCGEIYYA